MAFPGRISRRFEQVQGAVGVNREIRLWIARRPIVRWLRGGVHDRAQASARAVLKTSFIAAASRISIS